MKPIAAYGQWQFWCIVLACWAATPLLCLYWMATSPGRCAWAWKRTVLGEW